MTREEMRRVLRRHVEALNRHDVDRLVALYAADAVIVSPMFETVRGRAAVRDSFERLFTVYPDYAVEIRDSLFICEGNRAAEFSAVTGTPRVPLFGLPPTGQPIKYQAARLFTFRSGLIVDEQRLYDFRGVLERLDKARLEQEMTMAAAVQQMLQSGAERRGDFFELAASSLACRAIGGDFLECTDLPSGRLGVAVGDVSGKGPAAALLATMLHGMVSAIADAEHDPSDVMARVNHGLCRRNISPGFATLVYGVLSPGGRFVYSNGGHNPPILLTSSGARWLSAGGTVLGVFDDAVFPAETVQLHPGDTIVMYTDGVTEAVDRNGVDFTGDRLMALAGAARLAPPSALLETLVDAVREFSGGAVPADDATIVVTRFR